MQLKCLIYIHVYLYNYLVQYQEVLTVTVGLAGKTQNLFQNPQEFIYICKSFYLKFKKKRGKTSKLYRIQSYTPCLAIASCHEDWC